MPKLASHSLLGLFTAVASFTVSCGGYDGLQDTEENITSDSSDLAAPTCSASATRGDYCWNDGIINGAANTLYTCTGPNSNAAIKKVCPTRCVTMPSGFADVCGRTLSITSGWSTLASGNYDSANRLLWDNSADGTKRGGRNLVGATSSGTFTHMETRDSTFMYQCTDLVQGLSTNASSGEWVRGRSVSQNCSSIPDGTAVATFSGPSTFSGHVGFKRGCSATSVQLFDQNYVATGLIGRSNVTSTNYYEVILKE